MFNMTSYTQYRIGKKNKNKKKKIKRHIIYRRIYTSPRLSSDKLKNPYVSKPARELGYISTTDHVLVN